MILAVGGMVTLVAEVAPSDVGDILRTYNYYRYCGYSVRPVIE